MKEKYITNSKIVFRKEEDGALLYNLETGEIKILNEVGAFIFELCDGKHDKEEIINEIIKNFEIDKNTAEKDFDIFIKEMEKENLILRKELD
ncbi:MAG: PqqD family protein [candidate division WOR-3 bacterium]